MIKKSFRAYITIGIKEDLAEAYPELSIVQMQSLWNIMTDIFQKTGDKFLFVMDEWDALFHMAFATKADKDSYLIFLKSLLKDNAYVEFAYMTGVLPIAKYSSGCVFIPNRELMHQFDQMLLSHDSLGYIHRLAKISAKMLKATLDGDTDTMAEILAYAHDTESPILNYNSEIELSAVVNLVYLAARDRYQVKREDKSGRGFVDLIFYLERKNIDAIILELKVDHTPEEVIAQIKDKNYMLRFQGKLVENPTFTGRVLAVGISYSRATKMHSCKVEVLS